MHQKLCNVFAGAVDNLVSEKSTSRYEIHLRSMLLKARKLTDRCSRKNIRVELLQVPNTQRVDFMLTNGVKHKEATDCLVEAMCVSERADEAEAVHMANRCTVRIQVAQLQILKIPKQQSTIPEFPRMQNYCHSQEVFRKSTTHPVQSNNTTIKLPKYICKLRHQFTQGRQGMLR